MLVRPPGQGDLVECLSGSVIMMITDHPMISWGHAYYRTLGPTGNEMILRDDELKPLENKEPVSWIKRRLMQSTGTGKPGN